MEEKQKLDTQNGQNVNTERLEQFLFKEAKPEYEKLNATISPKKEEGGIKSSVFIDEKHPKNLILYGSPGTGKTYEAYAKAVSIVDLVLNRIKEKKLSLDSESFRKMVI